MRIKNIVVRLAVRLSAFLICLNVHTGLLAAEPGLSACSDGTVTAIVPARLQAPSSCADAWEAMLGKVQAQLRSGGVVLLGEVHDNPWHHQLRAQILAQLHHSGLGPALVFEHVRQDQQSHIDAYQGQSAQEFFAAVAWSESGWPSQVLFEPLFEQAFQARSPMWAADPPRALIRQVSRQGLASLPAQELTSLALNTELPAKELAALLKELEASHCGLLPAAAFAGMADAQRLRDAHLARRLMQARQRHGSAILFAGNGHVRSDRAVPWYIRQQAPSRSAVFVIDFQEAGPGSTGLAQLGAADWTVFTRAANRPDPCLAMRQQFKSKP